MSATLLDKQILTLHDSVMESHCEAMECGALEDLLSISVTLAARACDRVYREINREGEIPAADREHHVRFANLLLAAGRIGLDLIDEWQGKGYTVKGAEEYGDSVTDIRRMLLAIREHGKPSRKATVPSFESLTSDGQLPPQRWYDANFDGLRGI